MTDTDAQYLHARIDRLREQLQMDFNTVYQQIVELQRQIDALRHQNNFPSS